MIDKHYETDDGGYGYRCRCGLDILMHLLGMRMTVYCISSLPDIASFR